MTVPLAERSVADLIVELISNARAREDPYPVYSALRGHGPILDTGLGFWCATTYESCQWVLRDSRFGKDGDATMRRWGLGPVESFYRPSVLRSVMFANPPHHTRLRRPISRHLTASSLASLRPRLERIADDLIESLGDGGELEVMDVVAFPYSVTVIGELFGVPAEEREQFRSLVRQLTVVLEPTISAGELAAVQVADESVGAYFTDLFARRRGDGRGTDDLAGALASQVPAHLSDQEAVDTAIFLYGAGFETTSHLLGNALALLAGRPDLVVQLRHEPRLIPTAVSEFLRYDTSVQIAGRAAMTPVPAMGYEIPAGASLLVLLGSANRDPYAFENPDEFRLGRGQQPALSFGSGIHHCAGASLAVLESEILLRRLIERFDIEAIPGRQRRSGIALRGYERLPLALSLAARGSGAR